MALDGVEYDIFDEIPVGYACDCSRERMERALISLGKKDIEQIFDECRAEGKAEEIEICCQFCDRKYKFDRDDLKEILK